MKNDRCLSPKCAVVRKSYPPGMHGKRMTRGKSEYGTQLAMKQKIKRIYGIRERQFRKHFEDAKARPGVIGDNLLQRLELRLDNVVYRVGIAGSHRQAKQFVGHGLVAVNGKRVDIPSYEVKAGDTVEIRENKKSKSFFKQVSDILKNKKDFPAWIQFDDKSFKAKVVKKPGREDIEFSVDPQIIVEYYSR